METPDIIKKVRKIEIKTRGLSSQTFSGQYHSAFKGRGMAFSEVREYQYGDDIRNIDWNVTARFHHPYVKIFEEERELTVMILVDVSGSTCFGTKNSLKKDILTEVAAVLSFSAIQNNDKVGVVFFSDIVEKYIPPKKGSSHILRIIRELIDFKTESKGTNIDEAFRFLTNVQKKRCTTFVLSDFMNTYFTDSIRIASQKHDIIALRITDDREKELPSIGIVKFKDAETDEYFWADTSNKEIQKKYANYWRDFETDINQTFSKNGIDNIVINTDEDYIKPLKNLFKKREARW
ncbi:MAG: DUF58 domain-containing protein [Bacteroidota bacterium]